jgi:hypothetical protein
MKAALLKSYLRYRYKVIIIWLALIVLIDWSNRSSVLADLILPLLFVLRELYHYREKLEKIKRLRVKGLTEKDLLNIEFVKEWEDTRTGGVWGYCLKYGLFIGGFGFSLLFGLFYIIFFNQALKVTLAEPGKMFHFIGYCYIAGALFGVMVFRVLWFLNERRFIRLTDPLNKIFMSKRISFDDLI